MRARGEGERATREIAGVVAQNAPISFRSHTRDPLTWRSTGGYSDVDDADICG